MPRLRGEEALSTTLKLDELARLVDGTVRGDGGVAIHGVNGLREAQPGEIAFLSNPKYAPLLADTKASAVIVARGVSAPIPVIEVGNPDLAFARVAERFLGSVGRPAPGVHPSAVVAPGASLGSGVSVGACTVVEEDAVIGDGSVLYPQVYVGRGARLGKNVLLYPQAVVRERCVLGDRVILHCGAVIGADGFGYVTEKGVHHKIPQVGIVVLEDDVEIGANTTVDRARFGRTLVRRGAKIDNLVMIAHNVIVGEGSLLAAQAGVAGSTELGRYVMMAGQAGLAGHIKMGDRSAITAQGGTNKDIPPGTVVSGHHAVESKTYLKRLAALAKLPDAMTELKRLRKEVEDLKKQP